MSPPRTPPPITKWWPPQPWSVPSPLLTMARPNSDEVKVVTCERMSPSGIAARQFWK